MSGGKVGRAQRTIAQALERYGWRCECAQWMVDEDSDWWHGYWSVHAVAPPDNEYGLWTAFPGGRNLMHVLKAIEELGQAPTALIAPCSYCQKPMQIKPEHEGWTHQCMDCLIAEMNERYA